NAAALPPPGVRRGDIGVIPTSPMEVELLPMPGDDGRLPKVDFHSALVRARDAHGDLWTAQVDSAGLATFHALPPGRYELEVDLTGLSAPPATLSGTLTITSQAGQAFTGTLDVTQMDGSGSHPLSGPVTGCALDAASVDFSALFTVEAAARRHLGTVKMGVTMDSITNG